MKNLYIIGYYDIFLFVRCRDGFEVFIERLSKMDHVSAFFTFYIFFPIGDCNDFAFCSNYDTQKNIVFLWIKNKQHDPTADNNGSNSNRTNIYNFFSIYLSYLMEILKQKKKWKYVCNRFQKFLSPSDHKRFDCRKLSVYSHSTCFFALYAQINSTFYPERENNKKKLLILEQKMKQNRKLNAMTLVFGTALDIFR